MPFLKSSIGRKFIMAVTGAALLVFLTLHAAINFVALFSSDTYNAICGFLGSNWYAVTATVVLVILVFIHFGLAVHLVVRNLQIRGPEPYAVRLKSDDLKWSSQNMFTLGTVIILGLVLHLYNFWSKMMFAELTSSANNDLTSNGIHHIINTFHSIGEHSTSGYAYSALYLVWLTALWLHLNHGIWCAMQTLGLNNKTWFPRLKTISTIYTTIIILMYAAVAVLFCCGYTPAR